MDLLTTFLYILTFICYAATMVWLGITLFSIVSRNYFLINKIFDFFERETEPQFIPLTTPLMTDEELREKYDGVDFDRVEIMNVPNSIYNIV